MEKREREDEEEEEEEDTSSFGSADWARVCWADDFEERLESLEVPAASDPAQAQELSALVGALREDSRGCDETATENTRRIWLVELNEAKSSLASKRSRTRPESTEALALFDALLRDAEDRVHRAATMLRCICVQDLVRDLVVHLLQGEDGLVLIPRGKGGDEMVLKTERALRADHTKKEFEAGLCAKPDVVVGWGGVEWLLASVEVKKVSKAEEAEDGLEKSALRCCRGQAAVNSFAVLNACQPIKTVRTLFVDGAEYMFLEAKRKDPADEDELWSSYTLQRTRALRVENDLDAIVAGLLWWRDGVRSNAALAKNASEQEPPQQGGQGSGASGAGSPGRSSAPLPRGKPTRKALQGHNNPPLLEKLTLFGFC